MATTTMSLEVPLSPDRRRVLSGIATSIAAAIPLAPISVRAQAYPVRPVRLFVGTAAGGGADILARLIGHWLSERLGQTFIIENRPGAGTNVAAEAVIRAAPDGYELYLAAPANAINATLYENLSFNFIRDAAPVASIAQMPLVMVVIPSFPARTIPEFIAFAKSNPGKLCLASPGTGTSNHLSGELFKMMAGIKMVHVPYRGAGPALADLFGGRVQVLFDTLPSSIEHIKAGKLHALAVTTATRTEALPNIPSMAEFLPGYETNAWFGIAAPKRTPAEIVNKLNKELNAALGASEVRARLAELGAIPFAGSPADFGQFIARETEKWAKVVQFANIKPD